MEIWSKGDTLQWGRELPSAGINITATNGDFHSNAIRCYGNSKAEANDRRDLILACVSRLTMIKVAT